MSNLLKALLATAAPPPGVFVGAIIQPFTAAQQAKLKSLDGIGGSKVKPEKLHTTVIYSRAHVDSSLIQPLLDMIKLPVTGTVIGAAAFDALPKADGSRPDDVATLVLKLECEPVMQLHAALKELGLTHTYPELSPHVSLYYGVPRAECHAAVERFNAELASFDEPITFQLTGFHISQIDDQWATKNTKK